MKLNKWKLVWPLLILCSLVLFCTGCGINPVDTVTTLIPIITAIIGIVGAAGEAVLPAEAALIQTGVTLVTNGLNALVAELKAYEANKTATGALANVQAVFTSIHANLATLLAACQVKNALVAQKITAIVNGAIATVATIEAYIVSKQPTAADVASQSE